MSAPGALVFFNAFKQRLADGTWDMDTNPVTAALLTSTFSPNTSTMAVYADLTNEVANGNGYTTGGVALAGLSMTQTAGVGKFTANSISWTGSGAGFVARYCALYANATQNTVVKPLMGYFLLDSAPADVSFAAGNTVTVNWNASGIWTLN